MKNFLTIKTYQKFLIANKKWRKHPKLIVSTVAADDHELLVPGHLQSQ